MALIGIFLLAVAGWTAYQERFVVHGRFIAGYLAVVEGSEAYGLAGSLACLGIALFAPLFKRLTWVVVWLGFWQALAVVLPVAHAYLG
ncbi:MAG TPA: hypothetical protein PLF25_07065 [Accumulibacter sp.]|jgi:hypothetical protein|nr:hypothetical protein [Accumulibacter sp.]